jgi:p-aminobenzoyl-glutamate transporter AbgT
MTILYNENRAAIKTVGIINLVYNYYFCVKGVWIVQDVAVQITAKMV